MVMKSPSPMERQKVFDEMVLAKQQYYQYFDNLHKSSHAGTEVSVTSLEQDVIDLFLAQMLEKRFTLLRMEVDRPRDQLEDPPITVHGILARIKAERFGEEYVAYRQQNRKNEA